MKFTFKKQKKSTGLAGVCEPWPSTDIKINKKVIGYISAPSWQAEDCLWRIRLSVKKQKPDDNPNCDWHWVRIKKTFNNEPEARIWISENLEKVILKSKLELHYMED